MRKDITPVNNMKEAILSSPKFFLIIKGKHRAPKKKTYVNLFVKILSSLLSKKT
jgi:hypothetical protein